MLLPAAALAVPAPRWLDSKTLTPVVPPPVPLPAGALRTLAASPVNVTSIAYDVTLDPTTGATSGTVTVELGSPTVAITGLLLYMDPGLAVTATSSTTGGATTSVDDAYGYRYVSVSLAQPAPSGSTAAVTVDFSGTLACPDQQGRQSCNMQQELSYALQGSALPGVYDQFQVGGFNAWPAERSLTLRTPLGVSAVASGELTSESTEAGLLVRKWTTPGYASAGGYLLVLGQLETSPIAGGSLPSSVVYAKSVPNFTAKMGSWMGSILPFVDAQAGAPLPYAHLSVVKLPAGQGFPGTAGHGITLLSESYGGYGDAYFEETLAHEHAHQWWGVLVSPSDVGVTRFLTEGLATQAQVHYAARLLDGDARERFLSRRLREHQMLLRYHTNPAELPPLVVASPQLAPVDSVGHTVWAYIKSSATLEHLRAAIGDAAYAELLVKYAAKCQMADCATADFTAVAEQVSGESLTAFMSQWVYATNYPELRLSFSEQPAAEGVEVTLQVSGAEGLEVPLALLVTLETGEVLRRRVTLPKTGEAVSFQVPSAVRSVRPSARHDAVIWSRSAQDGDVDFDGEVDGFDLLYCARTVGMNTGLYQEGGEGLWQMNLDFDPRCDGVFDGQMTAADLGGIFAAFGSLREPKP